jgi:hypothetical protein
MASYPLLHISFNFPLQVATPDVYQTQLFSASPRNVSMVFFTVSLPASSQLLYLKFSSCDGSRAATNFSYPLEPSYCSARVWRSSIIRS